MAKISVGFRLSDQAIGHLEKITRATGATKTATVETALALMAKQLTNQKESKMRTLHQVLRLDFADIQLRYIGTVFGDDGSPQDDPDRIMTGSEWADTLQSMFADDSDNFFLDDHPDNVSAPEGGYYMQSGDIWHRGKQQGAACVFEVL